jgi:hypothetical protein
MASGDTLLVLTPLGGSPPATVPATIDTIAGADSVSAENIPCLDFDAAQDEYMDWYCVCPKNYASGGFTATIIWAALSDTSTNIVQFEAAFRAIEEDAEDLDTTDHAYAFNTVTATPSTTAGEVKYDDITFTDGSDSDEVDADDAFIFRLMRDVSDDTLTGDASVLAVHLKET